MELFSTHGNESMVIVDKPQEVRGCFGLREVMYSLILFGKRPKPEAET